MAGTVDAGCRRICAARLALVGRTNEPLEHWGGDVAGEGTVDVTGEHTPTNMNNLFDLQACKVSYHFFMHLVCYYWR